MFRALGEPLDGKRVTVFVDYQNVYMGARGAFGLQEAPHMEGQVHPFRVGQRARDLVPGRVLKEVVVFRGMPSPRYSERGYHAAQRQVGKWGNTPQVRVVTRQLNYRDPKHPKEKGIDVALAVEMVALAVDGEYDVAVLFSGDTDLLPAAEFARERMGNEAIEFAAWKPSDGRAANVLQLDGHSVRYHLFDEHWYRNFMWDPTDYNARTRRR